VPWDPEQYLRFAEERARPFLDLLARVPDLPVRHAADLGCGTGALTRRLLRRWPEAHVWAVDSSPEMLARARADAPDERLTFVQADLAVWTPSRPLDLVFSNAALQWLPDHAALLARLTGQLAPGGVLAVQVPNNRGEPAYRAAIVLAEAAPWAARAPAGRLLPWVETPAFYAERLAALGLSAEVWETVYEHALPDAAAIVAWLKGTALRPILAALSEAEGDTYLAALTAAVRDRYHVGPEGVVLRYRRLFFVGRRPPTPDEEPAT
jgi:trans-aconitate 2-methyltransferase